MYKQQMLGGYAIRVHLWNDAWIGDDTNRLHRPSPFARCRRPRLNEDGGKNLGGRE